MREGIKEDNLTHLVGSGPVKKVHLLEEKEYSWSFFGLEKGDLLEERVS